MSSLQSQVSTDPHPLLEDNSVKNPLVPKASAETPATEEETDVIDSLGTFSIGERGEIMFHEATATSEVMIDHLPVDFSVLIPWIRSIFYSYMIVLCFGSRLTFVKFHGNASQYPFVHCRHNSFYMSSTSLMSPSAMARLFQSFKNTDPND